MFARFSSTMWSPMPLTRVRASGLSNLPCSWRSLTIACASAGPTPWSSAASVAASAVLMFTGPAAAPSAAAAAQSPRLIEFRRALHEQVLERQALDRPDRFPELAARAMPDEELRAVAAVRAAIAHARARDLPQRLADPIDRLSACRGRQRLQLLAVDEVRKHGIAEHEALDATVERPGAGDAADDRRVREVAAQTRIGRDPIVDLRVEIRQLVDRAVALDEPRKHFGDEVVVLLDDLLVEPDRLAVVSLLLRQACADQRAAQLARLAADRVLEIRARELAV